MIRATNPSLDLSTYLESKSDVTHKKLRRILRTHFREKGATELSGLTQQPTEKPQRFLFALKESEAPQKYDESLVQAMFQHAGLTCF